MIRFSDMKAVEAVSDEVVKHMMQCGFGLEEARKFTDAGASLAIATLRSLDAPIERDFADKDDQKIVQQIALKMIRDAIDQVMRLNAEGAALEILARAFKL